jgi:hypothetical protein
MYYHQLPLLLLLLLNHTIHLVYSSCTYYTIRPGDTCYALGIVEALNPHIRCNHLRPGQRICVILTRTCDYLYKIKYGDTCYSLGIIQAFYPNINCFNLKPGQQICISNRIASVYGRINTNNDLPSCFNNRFYRVVNGDTCYLIGKRFGYNFYNLLAINFWSLNCNNLQIGQIICV